MNRSCNLHALLRHAKPLVFLSAACVLASAAAAPAAWYKWRSTLNGTVICAQVMQGAWEKADGPFKDAQCERRGSPG
ncbi:MAG TPA: hypothetical protein VJ652_20915 [Noviherbaspirillum sp.]|nr:hypothetical protein [Noviherbaspirillum sp.]